MPAFSYRSWACSSARTLSWLPVIFLLLQTACAITVNWLPVTLVLLAITFN